MAMVICDCCDGRVDAREIDTIETDKDENEDRHEHKICDWCRKSLPWAIVEIAAHGFYVFKGKTSKVAKLTKTDRANNIHAGEWTEHNVDEYPPLAARRLEIGAGRSSRAALAGKGCHGYQGDQGDPEEAEIRRKLAAFFFTPDPAYKSDGTLAASMSGREWF